MLHVYLIEMKLLMVLVQGTATVCESSFDVGHSSAVVLQHCQQCRVVAFDVGADLPGTTKEAYTFLQQRYGAKRVLLHSGEAALAAPSQHCDVFLVSGSHEEQLAVVELQKMRQHLHEGTTIVMRDVYCNEAHCEGGTMAWTAAVRQEDIEESFRHTSTDGQRGLAIGSWLGL